MSILVSIHSAHSNFSYFTSTGQHVIIGAKQNFVRPMMIIRQEKSNDYETVYRVVKAAFDSAEQADGNEQDLVNNLRKGDAFIPELSLVAEVDGRIVGHILFTKAMVGADTVLALAPLSVIPE